MKLLLTGEPRSGKTTLLERFIQAVTTKQGFIAREVRENGERIGFELVSSEGRKAVLASTQSHSKVRVGRYGVELDELNAFLTELPSVQPGCLLYIDEIGKMELVSEAFKALVMNYLDSGNPYVGTITSSYQDDFTRQVLMRNDVVLLVVNAENRDLLHDILAGLAGNVDVLGQLNVAAQEKVADLAKLYAKNSQFMQLKKLFKNAIKYVAENAVNRNGPEFIVEGDHGTHVVEAEEGQFTCDCPLFSGAGEYKNNSGECSHIQAVKISLHKI